MDLRKNMVRFVAVAFLAGLSVLLGATLAIQRSRSAVIRDRHGVRARLLMPKGLRLFSVEEYLMPGDDFVYTMSVGPRRSMCWRLQIKTAVAHGKQWEGAFDDYARTRLFKKSHSRHRGQDRLLAVYRISNGDYCRLMSQEIGSSGDLHITFVYHAKPGGARIRKYMGLVAFHVRRLWCTLHGNDAGYNSVTPRWPWM
jgi:hypothetical protein